MVVLCAFVHMLYVDGVCMVHIVLMIWILQGNLYLLSDHLLETYGHVSG